MHTFTVSDLFSIHSSASRPSRGCAKGIQSTILAGFICLAFVSTSTAADFSDSLKGMTITNAVGTNKPPIAVFTHTQNGETFTFDAGGSSDPDGTIIRYNWAFGDGTTSEGATASYALTGAANLQVTLTVFDNESGVALSQQTISPATEGVADDFSTDTSGDYTILAGGLKIYNGAAQASGAWTTTFAIHNKELASSDHGVEADVYTDGANATGGLMFRVNKLQNTGYIAWFANGSIVLSSYSAGTKKWLANFNGNYTEGTYHLRAEISGNVIKTYVNGNLALQTTNNAYATGNSVGLHIQPYGKNTLVEIDNFSGE